MPTPNNSTNVGADDIGATNVSGAVARQDGATPRPSSTDMSLVVAHAADAAQRPVGRATATMQSPDNLLATIHAVARGAEPSADQLLPADRLPQRGYGADRPQAQGLGRTIEAVAAAADRYAARSTEAGRPQEPLKPKSRCGCQPKAVPLRTFESQHEPSESRTAITHAVVRETYRVLLSGERLLGGVPMPVFDIPVTRPDLLFQVPAEGAPSGPPLTILEQLNRSIKGEPPAEALILDALPDPRVDDRSETLHVPGKPAQEVPRLTRWLVVPKPPVIESPVFRGPYGRLCLDALRNSPQGKTVRRFFAALYVSNGNAWPDHPTVDLIVQRILLAFCCCLKGAMEDENPYLSPFANRLDRLLRALDTVGYQTTLIGRKIVSPDPNPANLVGLLKEWWRQDGSAVDALIDECCYDSVPDFDPQYPFPKHDASDTWSFPFEESNGVYTLRPVVKPPQGWGGATWCACDCDLVIGWVDPPQEQGVTYSDLRSPPPAPVKLHDPYAASGVVGIARDSVLEIAWRCPAKKDNEQLVLDAFFRQLPGGGVTANCVFELRVMVDGKPLSDYKAGAVTFPNAGHGAGSMVPGSAAVRDLIYGWRIQIDPTRVYTIEVSIVCDLGLPTETRTLYELILAR